MIKSYSYDCKYRIHPFVSNSKILLNILSVKDYKLFNKMIYKSCNLILCKYLKSACSKVVKHKIVSDTKLFARMFLICLWFNYTYHEANLMQTKLHFLSGNY